MTYRVVLPDILARSIYHEYLRDTATNIYDDCLLHEWILRKFDYISHVHEAIVHPLTIDAEFSNESDFFFLYMKSGQKTDDQMSSAVMQKAMATLSHAISKELDRELLSKIQGLGESKHEGSK